MIVPYPLQDGSLIDSALARAAKWTEDMQPVSMISAFVPLDSFVSLGASNSLEANVIEQNCLKDGVKIFKRLSGGEAVFLSPNCVVISHILQSALIPKAVEFFSQNLDRIAAKLTAIGIKGIVRRGISDLAIGDKKILGCAIYKRPNFILFQAVLNVCEEPELIARYLKHPLREPDYRSSRSHAEFVTSLQAQGCEKTPEEIANLLKSFG